MLEAQVEVVRDPRRVEHRADQAGPNFCGLQVGHADPLDPRDRPELGKELLEGSGVSEILAVGRGVLADQHEFAHPVTGQPLGLGHDVGSRARHEGATERRDRAEGAPAVTTGRDLQ